MLVLSAREGDIIYIGETIKIVLLKHRDFSQGISIGIDAPKNVSVDREKIYLRKKKEATNVQF